MSASGLTPVGSGTRDPLPCHNQQDRFYVFSVTLYIGRIIILVQTSPCGGCADSRAAGQLSAPLSIHLALYHEGVELQIGWSGIYPSPLDFARICVRL